MKLHVGTVLRLTVLPSRTHPRQGGHPIHPALASASGGLSPLGASFSMDSPDHAPKLHRQPGGHECKLRGEDDLSGRIIQHRSTAPAPGRCQEVLVEEMSDKPARRKAGAVSRVGREAFH